MAAPSVLKRPAAFDLKGTMAPLTVLRLRSSDIQLVNMNPDDAGPNERRGVEDAPVDVRLGREVDDRVGVGDERRDDLAVGDVALGEPEPIAP
jgi:hypothetical protein